MSVIPIVSTSVMRMPLSGPITNLTLKIREFELPAANMKIFWQATGAFGVSYDGELNLPQQVADLFNSHLAAIQNNVLTQLNLTAAP